MSRPVHFGYNPPSSRRGLEDVEPRTFVADLERHLAVGAGSFDSIWVSDHLVSEHGYRLECWTLLTWIAARHPGLPIGQIVSAVGFRHAPLQAKMTATLAALMASAAEASGGRPARPFLGYGAGWAEPEYRAYGYDFPRAADRIDQLDEALRLTKALWSGDPTSFDGRWFRLEGAVCDPAPVPAPLVMVGGEGRRTMGVTARQADWWNLHHRGSERRRRLLSEMDEHCVAAGREPASLRRSMYLTLFLDRDRRVARARAGDRLDGDAPPFAGEPAELIDHVAALVEEGIDAFQLVFAGWPDESDVALFAEHVRPAFARS